METGVVETVLVQATVASNDGPVTNICGEFNYIILWTNSLTCIDSFVHSSSVPPPPPPAIEDAKKNLRNRRRSHIGVSQM